MSSALGSLRLAFLGLNRRRIFLAALLAETRLGNLLKDALGVFLPQAGIPEHFFSFLEDLFEPGRPFLPELGEIGWLGLGKLPRRHFKGVLEGMIDVEIVVFYFLSLEVLVSEYFLDRGPFVGIWVEHFGQQIGEHFAFGLQLGEELGQLLPFVVDYFGETLKGESLEHDLEQDDPQRPYVHALVVTLSQNDLWGHSEVPWVEVVVLPLSVLHEVLEFEDLRLEGLRQQNGLALETSMNHVFGVQVADSFANFPEQLFFRLFI